jgi:hypothetical protein
MQNLDNDRITLEVIKLSSLASALKTSLEAETDGEYAGAAELLHDRLMFLLAVLNGEASL